MKNAFERRLDKTEASVDGSNLSGQEILTHSSVLTNRRIAALKLALCETASEALRMPGNLQPAIDYFNMNLIIYLECEPILLNKNNLGLKKVVEDLVSEGYVLSSYLMLIGPKQAQAIDIFELTNIGLRIHRCFTLAFNEVRYLFRFTTPEIKGLENNLALFDSKSIFGKMRKDPRKIVPSEGEEKSDEPGIKGPFG